MKISLEWLKDYISFDLTAKEIGDILSNRGFPIEGIENINGSKVLDVELTSNRGDCLGHIGIAREIASAIDGTVTLPAIEINESEEDISAYVEVRIDEPLQCGRYTARVIRDVKVGPTPDWMRRRLEAVGVRSVNNVVDATNYAMMEHGQPPHAFDYDTLDGKTLIVRKAQNGEQLVSISGAKCQLNDAMLVIADAKRPVAIAGVMGGLETEVSDKTTTILLEEAHFAPVSIRSTARRLTLNSEASYRFERQVDKENIDWASRRCAQLIVQVAGGQMVRGAVDAYPGKAESDTVGMRLSRLKHLLGIDVPKDKVMTIFASLGFLPDAKTDDLVVCSVPTWRHDIYREADLIEEVARCYGLDKIPVEPKIHIEVARPGLREKTTDKVCSCLTGCGFFETVTVSFIDKKNAEMFTDTTAEMHLSAQDVGQKNSSLLRQNLIGSLIAVMQSNANAGNTNVRLFEIADTFISAETAGALPRERLRIGLVIESDFRTLRGVIEGLVQKVCSNAALTVTPAEFKWADAGAVLLLDGQPWGIAGTVSAQTAAAYNLERRTVCAAELDFETLLSKAGRITAAKPIPRFPAIVRDLSLIVDEPIRWEQIEARVQQAAPQELEGVTFSGLYRGKPIPEGKKSITLSLRFRDEQGTLRHEAVDAYEQTVVKALTDELNAQLRTA